MRTERVENALHFDISQGDDDVGMTQTTSSGVQANVRPKNTSSGTQSTTRMEESETQTRRIKTKERGSQATEDRSDEIEQLRHASEIEKQALIDQHAQNIERIRQQVMAEADTSHHRKKEEYRQEVLQQLQINEAEAQIIIQQAQQQTKQEAQTHFTNFIGRIIEFAEHQYRKERQQKEQAQKDAAEANKKN